MLFDGIELAVEPTSQRCPITATTTTTLELKRRFERHLSFVIGALLRACARTLANVAYRRASVTGGHLPQSGADSSSSVGLRQDAIANDTRLEMKTLKLKLLEFECFLSKDCWNI
jgi:hypothetical protein